MTLTKPKVQNNIRPDAIESDVKTSITEALEAIGARAVEMIREELSRGSPSGKLYKIGGQVHRASAEGEPPAEYSGALSASLAYEVNAEASNLQVYSNTPYGNYLELGTLHMAPRPFMAPVMDRLGPEIQMTVQAAVGGDTATNTSKDQSK